MMMKVTIQLNPKIYVESQITLADVSDLVIKEGVLGIVWWDGDAPHKTEYAPNSWLDYTSEEK